MKIKSDIQFEYTLTSACFCCPACEKVYKIELNFENDDRLLNFNCDKCGSLIEIPQHYRKTFHNKKCQVTVKKKGDK